tara:strand:- start:1184 stop:1675 length:492 start_codon:yes stop_codon:yes gene_type:complete
MEKVDGSINKLKGEITLKQIVEINDEIYKQCKCIHMINSEFIYTDMKLDNILYSNIDDNIKIFLGDLGSAIPNIALDKYSFTKALPPFVDKRVDTIKTNAEYIFLWNKIIIYAEFADIYIPPSHVTMTLENVYAICNSINEHYVSEMPNICEDFIKEMKMRDE